MHSVTLYSSAGALLGSGLLCLGLLLKRTPRSRLGSPGSVLSISDMSSSVLTSLALLLHRWYLRADADAVAEGAEAAEAAEGTCELGAVFFQYAVFLVPFGNAFLSLLSFSMSCYSGASGVERRAARLLERGRPEELRPRHSYRGLVLLSQWLLPALLAGLFQLAEHRGLELSGDDLACTLAANFPLESCEQEQGPSEYADIDDTLLWPSPNSSETLELLSRIQAIVRAALNDSQPSPRRLLDARGAQFFRCANNRCLVSRTFLQLNLFLFLGLVYFLPILASALLLLASRYKCREVARKLDDSRARKDEAACELSCEADSFQIFYRLFKLNVMLAVLFWSPLFLQLISKTFFCSNVPTWLQELAFLATILFTLFRNALDLKLAKIDAGTEQSNQRNTVHPDS